MSWLIRVLDRLVVDCLLRGMVVLVLPVPIPEPLADPTRPP